MALSEGGLQPGTIEDISKRLALWAKRDLSGIVRVEYSSEFSRQRVMQRLRNLLEPQGIAIQELTLPSFQDAETVVQKLIEQLEDVAKNPSTVASVTGFATAFSREMSLSEALRVLNFNRDRYLALPLKQIWWMTPAFMQTAIHAMPDLNSCFVQRLQLTEGVLEEVAGPQLQTADGSTTNIDEARQRAYGLIHQFEAAKNSEAAPTELLTTYVLPALEALSEVGAQKELRDLTQQFEGILSQLKATDSLELADSLERLANLYVEQGRYTEAETLCQKTLNLRKQLLGDEHPAIATSLNNLALVYKFQGRYSEVEPLYQQALNLRQRLLGEAHPHVASSLNNLAELYRSQGRYGEAESLYQQTLAIDRKVYGDEHSTIAIDLNNLAILYESQGRYSEAESLFTASPQLEATAFG